MNELLLLAAKWEDGSHGYHPLIYHLIDSGLTAQSLWEIGLTEGAKQQFCQWLGLNTQQTGQLLAYWVALHDLGKATPPFQSRCPLTKPLLEQAGFNFPELYPSDIEHHSLLSALILKRQLSKLGIIPERKAKALLYPIAGHHGTYPETRKFNSVHPDNLGNIRWQELQDQLIIQLSTIFPHPDSVLVQWTASGINAFVNVLTGLLITCDWISSDTNCFPYQDEAILTPLEYYHKLQPRVNHVLKKLGWQNWIPQNAKPIEFEHMFTDFSANAIQEAVVQQMEVLQDPFLMILEAPTGSGKTEAALYAADTWINKNHLRGMYVAMPTQATSNQMHHRVCRYLEHRLPDLNLQALLVHGNAMIQQEDVELDIHSIHDDDGNIANAQVNAHAWFTPRKRTLLAPFGVGTVDQTFLSVLYARHFTLRLFGLFRKVIIFDEIHAYDVYMTRLFKQLLSWLRSIGSSVVLLSATLPAETRRELLEAYDPAANYEAETVEFPRLSANSGGKITCISAGSLPSRSIDLHFLDDDPSAIVNELHQKLSEGGCAAVICNTVGRAQQIFHALQESGFWPQEELLLLHSRFPYCQREQLEKEVLTRYGKLDVPIQKPRSGIVIATQIIEQSLDLDFDILITELPPVDLLIQRIGRLQRHTHQAHPPMRPASLQVPACTIIMPAQNEDGLWRFGRNARIYEEYLLQRTALVLSKIEQISLPEESDYWINQVYSQQELDGLTAKQQTRLNELLQKMKKKEDEQETKAQNRMISSVDEEDFFHNRAMGVHLNEEDDNLSIHPDLRALTRSAEPSVQLICLVQEEDDKLYTLDGHALCSLTTVPDRKLIQHTLRSAVKVNNYWLVRYFQSQTCPSGWKKSAHLRHTFPLIFKNRECSLLTTEFRLLLRLDPEQGLIIEKLD